MRFSTARLLVPALVLSLALPIVHVAAQDSNNGVRSPSGVRQTSVRVQTGGDGQLIVELVGDVRVDVEREDARAARHASLIENAGRAVGCRQTEGRVDAEAENDVLIDAIAKVGGRHGAAQDHSATSGWP